jgi:hypothetical protein
VAGHQALSGHEGADLIVACIATGPTSCDGSVRSIQRRLLGQGPIAVLGCRLGHNLFAKVAIAAVRAKTCKGIGLDLDLA